MTKHLLLTAALTAGLVFCAAPRAHAFSPFGLMAALASDSDSDDTPAKSDKAVDTAHNDTTADVSDESGDADISATTPASAAQKTDGQAKNVAAMEPAGR